MTRPEEEDGYELWLRYRRVAEPALLERYQRQLTSIVLLGAAARADGEPATPTLAAAARELQSGLSGLLGRPVALSTDANQAGALVLGRTLTPGLEEFRRAAPTVPAPAPAGSAAASGAAARGEPLDELGRDGFALVTSTAGAPRTAIVGASDLGILYGAFQLLRLLQTGGDIRALALASSPRLGLRILNHWDNLDRTVERGYAGFSLWDWQKLPDYLDPRYTDYARACASIGINGSVLTNVNADALVLTDEYIDKVAALAQVFRPYGVRVYLTARFSSPIELDGLPTADPRDPDVRDWWRRRVDGIYRKIPDFGGFVVKANSEGQPGPQNYGCSHAEGANLLADALAEHGGTLMWRAFVYDHGVPVDRAKQAYDEFVPLDGSFRSNVLVQVKNGPIDFQPREPHHPLFGAMPKTPLLLELQLTQEYLGCATHLAYLAPLFKECLDTDTGAAGPGSTVVRVIDGSLHGHELTGMCAVSNIGNDRNWCGHPFAAANWYAFGRLCWEPGLSARALAEEWLRMTFCLEPRFLEGATKVMLDSREAIVDYMTPLGLHHQMALNHHYGPGPWVSEGRPDWTSVYYHRADENGLGFDRSPTGSNAVAQYFEPLRSQYAELDKCPEEHLLWFHHVGWDQRLRSGRTLWEELCYRYQRGVDSVRGFQAAWASLAESVDEARFRHVSDFLRIQEKEARWWRDACVLYFQTFSRRPLPAGYEPAEKSLEELRTLRHYYVPGIHNPFVAKKPRAMSATRLETRK
ncbi:MAG TPA: alpha-glucuronidase family glycosyl hydrolase [Polyangiaceae bacterium]|nr:alpha-glucuronidase family glycosyl hydrolase [Polyangiaceae bacterium]